MIQDLLAVACLVWYTFILCVCAIGVFQIRHHYVRSLRQSLAPTRPNNTCPHITIIRPVKGLEPYLYECLASTFIQTYPKDRLTIYFCISSPCDPAIPTLERLLADHAFFDAKLLIEEEDPNLSRAAGREENLGPNPKIRNMSRAYREAKGDLVWIVDCNVWVGPKVAGTMVDQLCGFFSVRSKKYKFVHQLPLVVDIPNSPSPSGASLLSEPSQTFEGTSSSISRSGGILEEMFLSTSHAKFYTAINTVAIAPCIVGKSNMFRRSHLNALTTNSPTSPGIDAFSSNICEDHLIGDLLWRCTVPPAVLNLAAQEGNPPPSNNNESLRWGNHALLAPTPENLAIQPTHHYPLRSYIDRRTRWLRVRKFTVPLATFIEPGTECLLCSAYGAWGLTTLSSLPLIHSTWTTFWIIWLLSVVAWAVCDRWVWGMLQSSNSEHGCAPPFAKKRSGRRGWGAWVMAWLGREVLAFPIWAWAVVGGVTVVWRGMRFWVGVDMRVHEIQDDKSAGKARRE